MLRTELPKKTLHIYFTSFPSGKDTSASLLETQAELWQNVPANDHKNVFTSCGHICFVSSLSCGYIMGMGCIFIAEVCSSMITVLDGRDRKLP